MLQLQERLRQRFPHWFRGPRARFSRPLIKAVGRWSRFDDIERFLQASGHLCEFAFVSAALDHLQVRYAVDDAALARIPATGKLVIVANHPSGALDALALLEAVGRVRRDVRIVANDFLMALEPLRGLLLPIRILGGRPSVADLQAIADTLDDDGCVIVFPAGEVSRLSPKGVRDTRWRPGFVRFARKSGAPILPIRVQARNSALFYGASAMFKPAGTFLLAREMYARRRRPLELHVGLLQHIADDDGNEAVIRRVRRQLYQLGQRATADAMPSSTPALSGMQPVAAAEVPALVAQAIAATRLLGSTSDGKEIRLTTLDSDSVLMRELGRLRELTFRQVGEGTGRSRDLDLYDTHYEHILLWDAAAQRLVGGYRVKRGACALAQQGLAGLYTASLFRYADDAITRIAQGMELGRSFVAPDYWGSRSLDYLWQGIGAYLRAFPTVRYLFGPVSISAALPPAARDALVAYYSRFYGATDALAEASRPFGYFAAPPDFSDMDADTAFDVLRGNLSALGASVPTLYKQYTDLCEPGGVRFLAFGVDPAFSDAIDGLIEVDIACMRPRKRQRYLGTRAEETACA